MKRLQLNLIIFALCLTGCKNPLSSSVKSNETIPSNQTGILKSLPSSCSQYALNQKYWINKSMSLLLSPKHLKLSLPNDYELIERSRFLNKSISIANILVWRHYIENSPDRVADEKIPRGLIPFAALVPYGSHSVGMVLDMMYEKLSALSSSKDAVRESWWGAGNSVVAAGEFSGLESYFLKSPKDAALGLILTNYYIYKDTVWQQLLLAECGVKPLITLLESISNGTIPPVPTIRGDALELDKMKATRYAEAWRDFAQGNNVAYAYKIIRIEQENFVHRLLFKNRNELGIKLGKEAAKNIKTPPVSDEDFQRTVPSFMDFANREVMDPDYSSLELRYKWLTSSTKAMLDLFSKRPDVLNNDHIRIFNTLDNMLAEYKYPIKYPKTGPAAENIRNYFGLQNAAAQQGKIASTPVSLTGEFYEMIADLESITSE